MNNKNSSQAYKKLLLKKEEILMNEKNNGNNGNHGNGNNGDNGNHGNHYGSGTRPGSSSALHIEHEI